MKLNIIKLTIKQLILQGIHVGYTKKLLNKQIKPYLLGSKNQFNIFNLKYARINIKYLLHLIINVISLRQNILVVNYYEEMGNFISLLKFKNCFFFEGAWRGGLLTNYKRIIFQQNFSILPRILPSTVIFLNTTADNWGLKECLNLNIPTALVTGSFFDLLSKTFYSIVANNQNLDALIFYTNMIGNAVKTGLNKEQARILNLNKKIWNI